MNEPSVSALSHLTFAPYRLNTFSAGHAHTAHGNKLFSSDGLAPVFEILTIIDLRLSLLLPIFALQLNILIPLLPPILLPLHLFPLIILPIHPVLASLHSFLPPFLPFPTVLQVFLPAAKLPLEVAFVLRLERMHVRIVRRLPVLWCWEESVESFTCRSGE